MNLITTIICDLSMLVHYPAKAKRPPVPKGERWAFEAIPLDQKREVRLLMPITREIRNTAEPSTFLDHVVFVLAHDAAAAGYIDQGEHDNGEEDTVDGLGSHNDQNGVEASGGHNDAGYDHGDVCPEEALILFAHLPAKQTGQDVGHAQGVMTAEEIPAAIRPMARKEQRSCPGWAPAEQPYQWRS